MSTRDNQKKYDYKSNVDSSIYSRVNIGQGANNKFDGPNLTHSGGSMNNPDEQVHHKSSFWATVIYYVVGSVISAGKYSQVCRFFTITSMARDSTSYSLRCCYYSARWPSDFSVQIGLLKNLCHPKRDSFIWYR